MPAPYSPDISIRPITVKRPDGGRPGLPPQVGTTPSVDVGGRPYSGDISGLTVVAKRRQKSQVEPAGEKIPGKKDTSHLDELKKKAGAFFSPPEPIRIRHHQMAIWPLYCRLPHMWLLQVGPLVNLRVHYLRCRSPPQPHHR